MEKLNYNKIREETLGNKRVHNNLVNLIKTARERELEDSILAFEGGQISYPGAYKRISEAKRTLTCLDRWDYILDFIKPEFKFKSAYKN